MSENEIEKENLGQPENPAPVQTDNAEQGPKKILGKFTSAEELAKAYDNLHAEFTQKCQLIAKLQQNSAKNDTAAAQPTETTKQAIIAEYLASVAAKPKSPALITGAGEVAFGPKPNARTLRDVLNIAEDYFKTKEVK